LVIVLLLLAILSIILAEFVFEGRVQATLIKNHEQKTIARAVAKAGQNAASGLLLNTAPDNESIFNNELVQLFQYQCMGLMESELTPPEEPEPAEGEDAPPMSGCGLWSLSIPYVLVDTPIDLNIYDEQARLNLNALLKYSRPQTQPGQTAPDPGQELNLTKNDFLFNAIFELFRYEALIHHIEISETDIINMLLNLIDYMDFGMVDGTFDSDRMDYFEYEDSDKAIPLKQGPLDTVDEIRYLPGMSDELFEAVAPFLTVYPADFDKGVFLDKVNFNAAPLEVLYAIYRGTSYRSGEPVLSEDDALRLAAETIQGATVTSSSSASAKPTPDNDSATTVKPYKRVLPEACKTNNLCAGMAMPENQNPRFYRIRSTAVTGNGLQTTITRVVKYDKSRNSIEPLYYREE
jgi:type II secretory pathway component PulK